MKLVMGFDETRSWDDGAKVADKPNKPGVLGGFGGLVPGPGPRSGIASADTEVCGDFPIGPLLSYEHGPSTRDMYDRCVILI